MARQHFAVGVNVDARAFGLFQQGSQIREVVAGDQNGLAFAGVNANRGWSRIAKRTRIGFIEQFHHLQIQFADFQGIAQQLLAGADGKVRKSSTS